MRSKFFILASIFIYQVSVSQNGPATTNTIATDAVVPVTENSNNNSSSSSSSGQIAIIDYKSVYEAETLEDEVKLAAERLKLTQAQQDVWQKAATSRREAEKQAKVQLAARTESYDKAPVYKGLRAAHTLFYETIIGYLTPAQKQLLEEERLIQEERQKRLAQLPPPPPTPTIAVAPVDSSAIKAADKEKTKKKGKKSVKKA